MGSTSYELARRHADSVGGSVVQVEGISMEPRLSDNDLVVIVPVKWSELRPGDIVQFTVSNQVRQDHNSMPTWIHQIAIIKGEWIRTSGLNNPDLDPFWINHKDIIGKAVAIYLDAGRKTQSVSERAMSYFRAQAEDGNFSKF